ncbi:MAG: hypothetical protein JWQ04_2059 [Pedosphaera sp.]|nr:hypothetical protein [Pedosphaera sp.]
MSQIRPSRWLLVYQCLAGLCDVTTGVLLVFAPGWTLTLMGVRHIPQPVDFASFIGAFVLSVGVAYLYAACLPMNAANAPRWQTVWWLTALSRTSVAGFLAWKILTGHLESAWLTVALTDGLVAVFQWIGLRAGWLCFKD